MEKAKNEHGINISAITFDVHGEMLVLDDNLLELVSGAAKRGPAPTPTPTPKYFPIQV